MMDKIPKKKTVSELQSCSVLFWISWPLKIKKLPLRAPQIPRRVHILHDDLVMQALVWLCMVRFRVIQFGAAWFSASHINLRQPYVFKHQI